MIRIAIAEDHQSLIDGLQMHIKNESDLSILATANDGAELLEKIEQEQPDLVLTDIRMPIMDGITLTKEIKKLYPDVRVLCLTMFSQDDAVRQMLAAGASGYILKNSSLKEVLEAIKTVGAGNKYFDGNINLPTDHQTQHKKGVLTKRQREIMALIAEGKTSTEIADELFIGAYTVRTHRKNIAKMLGLKGSGELLRYAVEHKYDFSDDSY